MRQYTTNKEQITQPKKRYIDYVMLSIVLILLTFGFIMVYSTTAYEASMNKKINNDAFFYLKRQVLATLVGVVGMIFATFIPRDFIKKCAIPVYIFSGITLFLILTPLGIRVNGAKRWLNLGVTNLQPAEIAKLAVVLCVAYFVCRLEDSMKGKKPYWFVFCIPLPLCFLTLVITKDLSSTVIIFLIGFSMLSVVHPNWKRTLIVISAGAAFIALVVGLVVLFPDFPLWSFRGDRILAWVDPGSDSEAAYQTSQALYTIGSGGFFGKGIGRSIQKLGVLPEAQNDMVFAVICEELGLFGAISILGLFTALIIRLSAIAQNAKDLFGALVTVGVLAHISLQVMFNVAVVTNLMPNTGISLPFISYGGSAVLVLLTELGIVLNVCRDHKF